MPRSQGVALSLFWRTFVLLAILLGSGIQRLKQHPQRMFITLAG